MTAADLPPFRTPRWVQILLVLSLAGNLLVAGLVAGSWLRGAPPGGLGRDPGFGPFAEALSDADRRDLRRTFQQRLPELRENRLAMRADMQAVLAALRTTPFDPAGLQQAMDQALSRLAGRIEVGRDLLMDRITAMDATERAAFADRLETALARGGRGRD